MSTLQDCDIFAVILPLARKLEHFCNLFVARSGIPRSSQARAFCFLAVEGRKRDVFQKDLENAMQIRPSSATALLRAVEEQGLIERCKNDGDGRFKKITFTPKAVALQAQVLEVHQQINGSLLAGISEGELEIFQQICGKIAANAGKTSGE